MVLTLAAYHFFRKQMFAIQLFEEVGMRQREALELFQVDRDSLLTDAKAFTADFQDAWMVKRDGELVPWRKGAYEPKRLIQQRVTDVWTWTIRIVIGWDAAPLLWALWDVAHSWL